MIGNSVSRAPELRAELEQLIDQSVAFEQRYAYDACPEGLLGINADIEYIADRPPDFEVEPPEL